jgi:3-hydroxyisobutyrate dehydrogenase-like beta-hydroxyacid dehydrogenase
MAKIAVLGLGTMGRALAAAFHRAGHDVTAWNRTREAGIAVARRAECQWADEPEGAIEASSLVVCCVTDHASARSFLDRPAVRTALAGRTLVQLTTGTSADARDEHAWAKCVGCRHLDGAIMVHPSTVGAPEAVCLYSGPKDVFDDWQLALQALGGIQMYLGEAIELAAALDLASNSVVFAANIGFLQGALICEQAGFPVETFGELWGSNIQLLGNALAERGRRISRADFTDANEPFAVTVNAFEIVARECRERGIELGLSHAMRTVAEAGLRLGLRGEEMSSVVQAFRQPR